RGDEHGIDVLAVEQSAVVRETISFARVLGPVEPSLIYIAHGNDLNVFGFGFFDKAVDVTGAHAAYADDSDADSIIRAQGVERFDGAKRKRAGGQGGGFYESTAGDFHRVF